MKYFDPDKIKIDENSYKNTPIYHIGYVTVKNLSYTKINSVNPLYLIINKYFEKSNGNRYSTVIYEELWNKLEIQLGQ